MHELSICESLLAIIEEQATAHDYTRVKTVWLEVGRLAGVEIEALYFSFDVVTRDTLAEGAKLAIIELPGQAWCFACGRSILLEDPFDVCPQCQRGALQITGGEELRIKELEVE